PRTPPQRVRDFVRDLYKYEIRRLRERYLRKEFPKREYSIRVDALRRQYPVLALRARAWLERYPPGPGLPPRPGLRRRLGTMTVIEIREPGGPDVLVPADRPEPVAGPGE